MTKRTFRNSSTVQLGEPDLGTSTWGTEYDTEFAAKLGLQTDIYLPVERLGARTPRSLKKGFVHHKDFEQLATQHTSAVSAHAELQLQLATLEQRLATLHTKEEQFMASVQNEHQVVETVKQQMEGLTDSLGKLLTSVEKNRAIMSLLSSLHDTPSPLPTSRQAAQDTQQVSTKLTGLEDKLSSLTHAVTSLAIEQRKLLNASQPQYINIEKEKKVKTERYDQLPTAHNSGLRNDYWKP